MAGMWEHEPIVVAIALVLYQYNVDHNVKAAAILSRDGGEDKHDPGTHSQLTTLIANSGSYVVNMLPWPWAIYYVAAAMAEYGKEAQARASLERRLRENPE